MAVQKDISDQLGLISSLLETLDKCSALFPVQSHCLLIIKTQQLRSQHHKGDIQLLSNQSQHIRLCFSNSFICAITASSWFCLSLSHHHAFLSFAAGKSWEFHQSYPGLWPEAQ